MDSGLIADGAGGKEIPLLVVVFDKDDHYSLILRHLKKAPGSRRRPDGGARRERLDQAQSFPREPRRKTRADYPSDVPHRLNHEPPPLPDNPTYLITACARYRARNTFCHPELGK
jgi:hypothetical protein